MNHREDNPYIPLVEEHEKIINIYEDIYKNKWKWNKYFKNTNDIVLEIWTWMWNFFSGECSKNKDKNYIWMEIKFKRLYNSAEKSKEKWAIDNYVLLKDFGQNIDKIFEEAEVSEVIIFFPDPWWKKDRQAKHRLFSEEFISKLHKIIKIWWKVFFKTDHLEYFNFTLDFFKKHWWFEKKIYSYDYEKELEYFDKQNMTEFEHIFREDRMKINYVEFIKN